MWIVQGFILSSSPSTSIDLRESGGVCGEIKRKWRGILGVKGKWREGYFGNFVNRREGYFSGILKIRGRGISGVSKNTRGRKRLL